MVYDAERNCTKPSWSESLKVGIKAYGSRGRKTCYFCSFCIKASKIVCLISCDHENSWNSKPWNLRQQKVLVTRRLNAHMGIFLLYSELAVFSSFSNRFAVESVIPKTE